jgi:signal transduction histidine kinase/ligand-binding sensor domain-containing protein
MPSATQSHDSTRSRQQRRRYQIGVLRTSNRSSLSISVAVFLAVLFSAVAQAQGNSTSSNTEVQVSLMQSTVRSPVIEGNDLHFARVSTSQGLSQTRVSQILQDNQGFMWFGTQYGLNRYDGYQFRVFTPEFGRSNSLSGAYIYSLFRDRSGVLWIGCDLFLDRFDPVTETFTHLSLENEDLNPIPARVVHISQDRNGTLWLATGKGLYGLDPETGRIIHHYLHDPLNPSSLSSNDVKSTGEDRNGMLWVADGNDLERFDGATGKVTLRVSLAESVRDYFSYHEDSFGVFWIGYYASGGRGGFASLDPKNNKLTRYSFYDRESGKKMPVGVAAILEGENGVLWLATMGEGLFKFDREHGTAIRYHHHPSEPESLADDELIALGGDREGNIWVGLHAKEPNVFSTQTRSFTPLPRQGLNPNRLGEDFVDAIYEDRQGVLWIGAGATLTRIDRKTGKHTSYQPLEHGLNNDLPAIAEDPTGFLWIGTNGQGLFRFDRSSGKFKTFRHKPADPSSLSDNTVIRLFIDHAGTMWLATWNGLDRYAAATERFVTYKRDVQSGTEQYFDIAEDRDGTLWLGGNSGLQHFDPATGKFTGYEHRINDPRSLGDNRVTSVVIDHSGTVWAATNGLDKLDRDSGTFTAYTTEDGLPSNRVHCILEDHRGDLWMSTNRGISRFDSVAKTFKNYSLIDGLAGMDLTGWRTCFKSPSGEMFFGGFSGATSFYPDRVVDSAYIPPIVFTDFRLFGQPVKVGSDSPLKKSISYADNITLSHQQSTFSLEFAALSFSDNTITRYRYKLDGLDQRWNEAGSDQRMVNYAALPAGYYTFHVQAATGQSGWGSPGATLHIRVLPPWWRTWWFRTIVVAASLFFIWGTYHIRMRSVEQHYRERRHAEEALRQAHAELIRANRVSTMGELTASLAHEVNQPIAAVVMNANACLRWLSRAQPDLEEARAAASKIAKDAWRAGEIVKRVRLLFKKGTLHRELVDLNEVIREMMLLLNSEANQFAVSVRTELAVDLPWVMGDRVQLQQVLMNLMMNGIDAMKDMNGTRELTIQSHWGEVGQVLISVSDTGVGLPPQQADKIFDAFFTTKTHGTGMGLGISRSIIESNGGHLWAADNSPHGARFYFTLPTSDETRDLVMSGDRPEPAGRLHGNDRSPKAMDAGRPTQRE